MADAIKDDIMGPWVVHSPTGRPGMAEWNPAGRDENVAVVQFGADGPFEEIPVDDLELVSKYEFESMRDL